MGRGCRGFKTVRIVGCTKRQSKTGIADAATVVVHRLTGAPATEADGTAPRSGPATASGQHDFDLIVRYGSHDTFLHCPSVC